MQKAFKYLLIFSALCLITSNLKADDWDLFPFGQRSLYLSDKPYIGEYRNIQLISQDSIEVQGDSIIQYFNRKIYDYQIDTCDMHAIANELNYSVFPNSFLVDKIIQNNNTLFYESPTSNQPFKFYQHAQQGDSWVVTSDDPINEFDEITFYCDAIIVENFLNLTDSVKVFSLTSNGYSYGQTPISDYTFKLSKNYGLIEFVTFSSIMRHPPFAEFESLELISIEIEENKIGYNKSFEDFFHLQAGDVLLWEKTSLNYDVTVIEKQYLDVITNAFISSDSVIYTINRTTNNYTTNPVNQTYQTGLLKKFYKSDFSDAFESLPYTITPHNFSPSFYFYGGQNSNEELSGPWSNVGMSFEIDQSIQDTIFNLQFENQHHFYGCNPEILADYTIRYTLNSKTGFSQYSNYPDLTRIIGCEVDGVVSGDIILDVVENISIEELKISPNPVRDIIHLKTNDYSSKKVEITDISGKSVKEFNLSSHQINVQNLATGIYYLKVKEENRVLIGKFIKQ